MKRVACLIVSAALSAASPAAAQTVRAILIGDTEDVNIGTGVAANLNKMKALLKQVKDEGKLDVTIAELREDDFNCSGILKIVRDVKIDPDDTVVFYYAGHGFRRTETQSQFPEFDCRRTNSTDRADLAGVTNDLLKPAGRVGRSEPRLLLAIADTCNVLIEETVPKQARPRPPGFARTNREAAFHRLFADYSGTLIMSGATPGDPSWYMSSGGFFTEQLLATIDDHLSTVARARWEDIASEATKQIFVPLTTPTVQKPQFAPSNLHANADQ